MTGGDYMSAVKKFYLVLVDGDCVFRGSYSNSESVYFAIRQVLDIVGRPDVIVNIALDFDKRR